MGILGSRGAYWSGLRSTEVNRDLPVLRTGELTCGTFAAEDGLGLLEFVAGLEVLITACPRSGKSVRVKMLGVIAGSENTTLGLDGSEEPLDEDMRVGASVLEG